MTYSALPASGPIIATMPIFVTFEPRSVTLWWYGLCYARLRLLLYGKRIVSWHSLTAQGGRPGGGPRLVGVLWGGQFTGITIPHATAQKALFDPDDREDEKGAGGRGWGAGWGLFPSARLCGGGRDSRRKNSKKAENYP